MDINPNKVVKMESVDFQLLFKKYYIMHYRNFFQPEK